MRKMHANVPFYELAYSLYLAKTYCRNETISDMVKIGRDYSPPKPLAGQ